MHIDALLVLFKLLLFGLLCYKLTQLVKLYVIPLLEQELDTEQKQQTELFEKEKLLICTQNRLENQMSNQKKTFALLDKNVQAWQACLLAQKEEQERAARHTLINLDEKRKIQQHYLALAKDGAVIIPETCKQACAELTVKFGNHEHGSEQLHVFITKLVSKSS